MKVLQIAPIGLPVKPDITYGGTERVILYLDEVFTELGHRSMVAASGDSRVYGKLLETIPKSIWNISQNENELGRRKIIISEDLYNKHYKRCVEFMLDKGKNLDIIHDHPGSGIITSEEYGRYKDQIDTPILSTLHGVFSDKDKKRNEEWIRLQKEGGKVFFNAISNSQKRSFERIGINIEEVVYHGIPLDSFGLEREKEDYLFSIGRISPEKGQDIAIDIAKRTDRSLIIAGEVHSVDEAYWREKIEPHIDGDQIKFVGPKTDDEKILLYQKAAGFIFPLQWSEPFGLILIESMACGTPVVTFNRGSVPEVVEDGKTGFVIQETGDREKDLEAMVEAVNNLNLIKPEDCRSLVEDKFSIEKEAENYLNLYERLIDSSKKR